MENKNSGERNPKAEEEGDDHDGEKLVMEDAFKDVEVPSWRKQITFRAMVTSLLLSIVFNFIVCKLNLTTGVIPSLNVAAGLLGFAIVKAWTSLLEKFGVLKQPFTRQENTVIQTCVVASSGIAFSSMCSLDFIYINHFLNVVLYIIIRKYNCGAKIKWDFTTSKHIYNPSLYLLVARFLVIIK